MWILSVEWALSPIKKLVVALTVCATIAVVRTSCLALPQHRIQVSQLNTACGSNSSQQLPAPSSTIEARWWEKMLPPYHAIFSTNGSYHLILAWNQEQWQHPSWFVGLKGLFAKQLIGRQLTHNTGIYNQLLDTLWEGRVFLFTLQPYLISTGTVVDFSPSLWWWSSVPYPTLTLTRNFIAVSGPFILCELISHPLTCRLR